MSLDKRASGILVHISSLPSPHGIGDTGQGAYRFVDFLKNSGQSCWQVLPLNPTDLQYGNSPYSSTSAFAASPLLVSPEMLVQEGLLEKGELGPLPAFPGDRVDYEKVAGHKKRILQAAFESFKRSGQGRDEFECFCKDNSHWLEDFALFVCLKESFQGRPWNEWPTGLRDRDPEAIKKAGDDFSEQVEKEMFIQHLFFKQWSALKAYANQSGVSIFGDIPIYVDYDSADVWSSPSMFKLGPDKEREYVAGVPPDYFSSTGQLWGNPLYDWERLEESGFEWWLMRMEHTLRLYDLVRIDHFRGLVGFWQVPAFEETAVSGEWVQAPVYEFMKALRDRFPDLPIVAEDLGVITPDVREVMRSFGLPGMKVLLFAFGEDNPEHPYLPHNFENNCVAYTGTHDNNTVRGWFEAEAGPEDKKRLARYLGRKVSKKDVHTELVRLAMMSVANLAVFPVQDLLGLDGSARMNTPAKRGGNWEWRLPAESLSPSLQQEFLMMTRIYGRAPHATSQT